MAPDDELEPDDLPGLDREPPDPGQTEVPEAGESPGDRLGQPDADPAERVDEAVRRWEHDLDAANASNKAFAQAREERARRIMEIDDEVRALAPKSPPEKDFVDQAKAALTEAEDLLENAETGEDLELVDDAIAYARSEWQRASRAVPGRRASRSSVGAVRAKRRRFGFPTTIRGWIGFGVAAFVAVVALIFALLQSNGDEVEAAPPAGEASNVVTTVPATTAAPTTTIPVTAGPAVTDPAAAALPSAWSYTATKTGDPVAPPDFLDVAAVGTSIPAVLVVEEVCAAGECTFRSTFDLEAMLLAPAEFGERAPAIWGQDGATWRVETIAHTVQSDTAGVGTCVIIMTDAWQVTVTAADIVGDRPVASSFTGTLTRTNAIDPASSTAGADICGDWRHQETWAVEGNALPTG